MEASEWFIFLTSNKKNIMSVYVLSCLSDFYILLALLTIDMLCSSNEGCIQVASEVNHTPLENMVIDMFGLDTKSDPFESKQGKKVKRRQRQRKLYNEAEGLC